MKRFLLMLAMLLPLTAFAADDDAMLTDFQGLSKLMRAHGIEPAHVQWNPIEMMCLGLKKPNDFIAYNRCRLDKAFDQHIFNNDDGDCSDAALTAYPNILLIPEPTVVTEITAGTATVTTIQPPTLTREQIMAGRNITFSQCMRGRGWINAHDWQQGRKDY